MCRSVGLVLEQSRQSDCIMRDQCKQSASRVQAKEKIQRQEKQLTHNYFFFILSQNLAFYGLVLFFVYFRDQKTGLEIGWKLENRTRNRLETRKQDQKTRLSRAKNRLENKTSINLAQDYPGLENKPNTGLKTGLESRTKKLN